MTGKGAPAAAANTSAGASQGQLGELNQLALLPMGRNRLATADSDPNPMASISASTSRIPAAGPAHQA